MKTVKYLDSNVFVRLIVGDVQDHLKKSRSIFQDIEESKTTGKVSVLVINEVIWILENFYELDRKIYIPQLLKIVALKDVKIIETKKQLLIKVINKMMNNMFDFTDNYLSEVATENTIFSFDRDFEKLFRKK